VICISKFFLNVGSDGNGDARASNELTEHLGFDRSGDARAANGLTEHVGSWKR
jgi:hypothetical protein